MSGLTCNACNKEFDNDQQQKTHYRSEWHRYNLKRKVAGVPGITEALFQAKLSAVSEKTTRSNVTPQIYGCTICGKEYRSSKAHTEHLKSRTHIAKSSRGPNSSSESIAVIKPAPIRHTSKLSSSTEALSGMSDEEEEESEGSDAANEWEEVDPNSMDVVFEENDDSDSENDDMDDLMDLDPLICFICDQDHKNIEACMVHMHKKHGFFIPDIEYLKDPKGFLTYVGLKVKQDFKCLYCNDRCHPFQSLEAVRKHMISKAHCKVHYGDGDDDEEGELEDFYDYTSSYIDGDESQLVGLDDPNNNIELGSGGSELIIRKKTENGASVVTLGSREFMRYYRQNPRPSQQRDVALAAALTLRYKSMGLATVQSRKQMVRLKVLREMNRNGVEAMRSKMGMKSNVIRNLPKNVTH